MVEGLSPRKIVVTDLDGTLIDGNSLHLYICCALSLRRPLLSLKICAWLGLRLIRLVSHRRMKFAVLGLITPDQRLKDKFVGHFDAMRRPETAKLLDTYRSQGATVLLATAAPDVYIPWIWDGDFVATRIKDNPNLKECRGEEKLTAIRQYMTKADTLEAVVTDHHDDLPLLLEGANNFLVSPSPQTIKRLINKNIRYTLV